MMHASSAVVFCAQLGGYVALSTALERRFYAARAAEAQQWRAQAHTPPHAPADFAVSADGVVQVRVAPRARAPAP